jgi:hypothetical protein
MDNDTMSFSASVNTNGAVDTSSTDEPAVAPPGRSRLAVAMFVTAGLLLAAAIAFGVMGFQAQSKASDERDQADAAAQHRHASAAQEQAFRDDRQQLEDDLRALPDKYTAIESTYSELYDAHDRYIEISNRSVVIYNSGDTAGTVALLQGEGTAALNEMNAKRDAAKQAVQAAEDAVAKIEEGL